MKDIIQPVEEFEYPLECHVCHAKWVTEADDVRVGKFKKDPNTYWFDGSAVAVDKFYCSCPNGCALEIIPTETVPALLAKRVKEDRTNG